MADQLITVATFATPTEAAIVRNRLEAEGVLAFLADDETVAMAWHLGGAVGGVKLQVAEKDAPKAHAVLDNLAAELGGEAGFAEGDESRPEEFEAGGDDEPIDQPTASSGAGDSEVQNEVQNEVEDEEEEEEEEEEDAVASEEDESKRRGEPSADDLVNTAVKAAVFGYLFLPLQLYSLWLLMRLTVRGDELNPRQQRQAVVALLLNVPIVLGMLVLAWAMVSAGQ